MTAPVATITQTQLDDVVGGMGRGDRIALTALGTAAALAAGVNIWCARGDHRTTHPDLCPTPKPTPIPTFGH